jgi:hypothetical protein
MKPIETPNRDGSVYQSALNLMALFFNRRNDHRNLLMSLGSMPAKLSRVGNLFLDSEPFFTELALSK